MNFNINEYNIASCIFKVFFVVFELTWTNNGLFFMLKGLIKTVTVYTYS